MRAAILDSLGQVPRAGAFAEPTAVNGDSLVSVTGAAIKQLDRLIAAGKHYSRPAAFPVIPGTDGVGRTDDGRRVYFVVDRAPFGAMAERAPASWTVDLPDGLDDTMAAAIVNPALGAWLPMAWRGALRPGENVLVLGATGASGRLAVAAARSLGAGRVIAAGRRLDVLASLGADATIDLDLPSDALARAFAEEAAHGLDVIVDYVWGRPVETLIGVLAKTDLRADAATSSIRLVSVGEMAGPTITLPSSALRGSRLQILGSGTASFPPLDQLQRLIADILARAARGEITIAVEQVALDGVATAWSAAPSDRRIVLLP